MNSLWNFADFKCWCDQALNRTGCSNFDLDCEIDSVITDVCVFCVYFVDVSFLIYCFQKELFSFPHWQSEYFRLLFHTVKPSDIVTMRPQ